MSYNTSEETWKDIPNTFGLYQASTLGKFKRGDKSIKLYLQPDGYLKIHLHIYGKVKQRYAHVIVWDTFNEEKSERFIKVVDHIDENKSNIALSNLQLLSTRQNVSKAKYKKSKTSKYTGVSFDRNTKKWRAAIRINGKSKYIGYYLDELTAHEAYMEFAKRIDVFTNEKPSPMII